MSPTRSSRSREAGRPIQRWRDHNHEAIEAAKAENGGNLDHVEAYNTTEFPHKDEWSEENLPEILFYLQVPPSKYEGVKIETLKDENGNCVLSDEKNRIRDFEILPRRISLDVPGWLVEAWRRIDTRISYRDILDRQVADPIRNLKKLTKNALQNHCRRDCRKVLGCWVEYGRRDESHKTEVEAIENLTQENIVLNTVLSPCKLAPHRLVKVKLERVHSTGRFYKVPMEVTSKNVLETTFPIDHFTKFMPNHEATLDSVMTPAMIAALNLLNRLSDRAMLHKLDHWTKLPNPCLPVSWFDRTKRKPDQNTSEDGGCEICAYRPGRKYPSQTPLEKAKAARTASRKRSGLMAATSKACSPSNAKRRRYLAGTRAHTTSAAYAESSESEHFDSSRLPGGYRFVEEDRSDLDEETDSASVDSSFTISIDRQESEVQFPNLMDDSVSQPKMDQEDTDFYWNMHGWLYPSRQSPKSPTPKIKTESDQSPATSSLAVLQHTHSFMDNQYPCLGPRKPCLPPPQPLTQAQLQDHEAFQKQLQLARVAIYNSGESTCDDSKALWCSSNHPSQTLLPTAFNHSFSTNSYKSGSSPASPSYKDISAATSFQEEHLLAQDEYDLPQPCTYGNVCHQNLKHEVSRYNSPFGMQNDARHISGPFMYQSSPGPRHAKPLTPVAAARMRDVLFAGAHAAADKLAALCGNRNSLSNLFESAADAAIDPTLSSEQADQLMSDDQMSNITAAKLDDDTVAFAMPSHAVEAHDDGGNRMRFATPPPLEDS